MPALLFSAGSNAVLESVHGSVFNDPVSRRLVFRWIAPLPEPVDSFKFVHGEDIVFSNDFVACKDVHDFKPKPVSVLLDPDLAIRTKVLSSLWTGYSKALAVHRHVATQHESEAIDIPSHRPYYNWQQ
jgi:hypothetical protein